MSRARWYVVLTTSGHLQARYSETPLPSWVEAFRTEAHASAIAERLNEGIVARQVARDFGPGAAEVAS